MYSSYNIVLYYNTILYVIIGRRFIIQSAEFARGLGPAAKRLFSPSRRRRSRSCEYVDFSIRTAILLYCVLTICTRFLYFYDGREKHSQTRYNGDWRVCERARDRRISHYPHTHAGSHRQMYTHII